MTVVIEKGEQMTKNKDKVNKSDTCDFCKRHTDDVGLLVEGGQHPNPIYICEDCVELSKRILVQERKKAGIKSNISKTPNPRDIHEFLNDFVIGQDDAKQTLACGSYSHYKRICDQVIVFEEDDPLKDVELEKSNILMLGPTGVGKTHLVQTLAKVLNVPFAIADATTLTEAGYVGEDVENLLLKLIHEADFDMDRAERGIIYIDEIDKIGKKTQNVSITRDVSGEGVQQAILKLLEGTIANVPPQGGRKHPEQQYLQIDTKNILFICGGTFVGLDKIISKRLGKSKIGFMGELSEKEKLEVLSEVTTEDLVEFGLIPELIGRLPVLTTLRSLDEEAMVRILKEPRNALLKQYQKQFRLDGAYLEFEDDAILELAKQAMKSDTGARSLRGVVEKLMKPLIYTLPELNSGTVITITAEMVRGEVPVCDSKEAA
ncbi:MAG: ATP-dependent Clp protease ATP-binding subunit ClpX [Candidatus Thorarchaeota archaeon]